MLAVPEYGCAFRLDLGPLATIAPRKSRDLSRPIAEKPRNNKNNAHSPQIAPAS